MDRFRTQILSYIEKLLLAIPLRLHYNTRKAKAPNHGAFAFLRFYGEREEIVSVYDVSELDFRLCNDMKNERILCFKAGAPA